MVIWGDKKGFFIRSELSYMYMSEVYMCTPIWPADRKLDLSIYWTAGPGC